MTAFDPTKRRDLPFPLAGANTADRSPVALPVAQGAPQAPEQAVLPRVPVEHPAAEPVMPEPAPQEQPTLARAKVPGQTQDLANRFPGGGKSPAQTELERVHQRGTGIHNIHNPVLKTLATIGDVLAGTFAPRAEMLIPGTEGHHALELARAGQAVKGENEAANQQSEATLRKANAGHLQAETDTLIPAQAHHAEAQATEAESLPAFHEAQNENVRLRQAGVDEHNRATEDAALKAQEAKATASKAAADAKWRSLGFDPDTQAPLADDQLSEPLKLQRIHGELMKAQGEAAAAKAEYDRARAANAPDQAQLALVRLQQAQQRMTIQKERLGLSESQFELRSQGTVNGVAPAGTLLTEDNRPVGTANAQNVRPTGTQINRGELATSAQHQLEDMRSIVQKRSEIFGPMAGRKTDFSVWLGSDDPDAAAFRTARTILGDHEAGTFGGRSNETVKNLEAAAGLFKTNPDAVQASLNQLEKANKTFIGQGTRKTVGSNTAAAQPVVPPPAASGGGDMITMKLPNGQTGQIHASQKDNFIKANPGATVVTGGVTNAK